MPVWIEPKGSRKVKQTAFVAYLREMRDRCVYSASGATTAEYQATCIARSQVYDRVATQLEGLI